MIGGFTVQTMTQQHLDAWVVPAVITVKAPAKIATKAIKITSVLTFLRTITLHHLLSRLGYPRLF